MDDATEKAPDPAEAIREVTLSDEDILDAMARIPGYLDITTEDFRQIYHLAHAHATARLLGGLIAEGLMHAVEPLRPAMKLDEAARTLVSSGRKGLPVVDDAGRVVGMLTETDFLRRLQAGTFLELLLRLLGNDCEVNHRCHETEVREAMTAPAVTVDAAAGFPEMLRAFRRHEGRAMAVVDDRSRLLGLLLRKDFLAAIDREVHG